MSHTTQVILCSSNVQPRVAQTHLLRSAVCRGRLLYGLSVLRDGSFVLQLKLQAVADDPHVGKVQALGCRVCLHVNMWQGLRIKV